MKNEPKDAVRRFERLDFKATDLDRPEVTTEGFWKLDGKVARTGVQIYHDADGGTRRELRLEGDVKASVVGFAQKPVTNGHPPRLVDPDNVKQYAAGAVGDASYKDGWVRAPITVWAKDAIDAIRDGRAQLSVGYSCRLVDEPGVHDGQEYDCRQTDITVNHLAIVDVARAGPEARLRLDAGDMITGDFRQVCDAVIASDSTKPTATEQRETTRMQTMKLDGLDVKVESANDQSIIEKAIESARKDGETKAASEKKRADEATADLVKANADKVSLQAKVDAAEAALKRDVKCDECAGKGKISNEDCANCAGKGEMKADALLDFEARKASRARSDARAAVTRAASRAKLLLQAAEHLSSHENLDGKSEPEIKKLVLVKLNKDLKLDGKSDDYVDAYFDAEMKRHAKPAPIQRVLTVLDGDKDPPVVENADSDGMSAKQRMDAEYDKHYFKNRTAAK